MQFLNRSHKEANAREGVCAYVRHSPKRPSQLIETFRFWFQSFIWDFLSTW